MTDTPPLLACRGVTKRFGQVVANQDIHLDIHAGEVQALLGENGAGKSTLMSILAGRYRPDSGEILMDGKQVRFTAPAQALEMGVGMVYQRFMLVDPLTVLENLCLAVAGKRLAARAVRTRAQELAQRYGLAADFARRVSTLSMGERQRVEILKLLLQQARILIFDEPTAVLAEPEVEGFFQILARLKADMRGVVFITHKLDEVMAVADRITILRQGRVMARIVPGQVRSRRELARLMVGREFVLKVDKPDIEPGEEVLRAENLSGIDDSGRPSFQDVSLDLRRGEVLAVVGVAGNGQEALAAALAGCGGRISAGALTFLGTSHPIRLWPGAARELFAFVPADRHGTGSAPAMTLTENFLLTRARQLPFWFSLEQTDTLTDEAIREFKIKASGAQALAGSLSGGNLQKFLLARELSREPALFMAEQPTQGLDVQATEEIWQAILAQRAHSAILLFTSDIKEALSLADRLTVMFRGRILETVDARDENAVGRIGLLMAGSREGHGHTPEVGHAP